MIYHVTPLGFPFSVVFLFFLLSSSFKQVDHQQYMPLLLSMADDCRSVFFSPSEMLAVLARQSSSQFEGFMNAFVNGLP